MGASVGAHVIKLITLGIPSDCAWGRGPGLTETGSSLFWVGSSCSVGDICTSWTNGAVVWWTAE